MTNQKLPRISSCLIAAVLIAASVIDVSTPNALATSHHRSSFNGQDPDGKIREDLMYFSPEDPNAANSIHVRISTGSSLLYNRQTNPWSGSNPVGDNKYQYYPGDFDGDGFTDIGYFDPRENKFYVAHSTGSRFEPAVEWLSCTPFANGQGAFYVGDFDGNGRTTLAISTQSTEASM